MKIFLETIVTIIGISFLAEFLNYRILKSFHEDDDMWSYTPEEFIKIACYFIITVLYLAYMASIELMHISL